MAVTELLRDTGRATATVNTYLSALKGVAKEAWMLKLMDVESFQHIRAVRNLRGSRLPARPCPCRRRRSVRCLLPVRPMIPVSASAMRRCWPSFSAAACDGRRPWFWICVTLSQMNGHFVCWARETRSGWPICRPAPGSVLKKWVEEVRGEKEGPLFTRIRRFDTLTNDRLTDQAVYHVLQVRQRQAGIAKCAPHDLRRTFATAMLDNGEDLITVKDAMGHAQRHHHSSSMIAVERHACAQLVTVWI